MRTLFPPLLAVFAATGCAAPGQPPVGLKEVYVEAPGPQEGLHLSPFPVDPRSEGRAYSASRALDGRRDSLRKLALLLGQEPEPAAEGEGEAPFAPDLSGFPAGAPPAILLFPDRAEDRESTVCYLGHAAYRRERLGDLVHHVRLFLLNRGEVPLRVALGEVALEVPAGVEPGARTGLLGSARELEITAGDDEAEAEHLVVEPGEGRVGHVFFSDDRPPSALLVRWTVEEVRASQEDPGADGAPAEAGAWELAVVLARRYILAEGRITQLERRVADGDPLVARHPAGGAFTEPRMPAIGAGQ
jgi:hypothetical protein